MSFVEIKGEIGEPRAGFWSPWSPDTMDISVKMATTVWFRGGNCYVLGSGGAGLVTDALAWKWKRKAIYQRGMRLMRASVATSICEDAGPIWSPDKDGSSLSRGSARVGSSHWTFRRCSMWTFFFFFHCKGYLLLLLMAPRRFFMSLLSWGFLELRKSPNLRRPFSAFLIERIPQQAF